MAKAKAKLDGAVNEADVMALHITGATCNVSFVVDSDFGGSPVEEATVTLPPAQVNRMNKVIKAVLKIINKT